MISDATTPTVEEIALTLRERVKALLRENRFLRDTLKIIAQGDLNADACWTIAAGALDTVINVYSDVHSPEGKAPPPPPPPPLPGGAPIVTERAQTIITERGDKGLIT